MVKKRKGLMVIPLLFLMFVGSVSASPNYDRDIYVDSTCTPGSGIYVRGAQIGSDDGYYPKVTFVRIYFEWYKNGVYTGSKQSEDSTAPISVSNYTAACVHEASSSYKMTWSERWETEDGNVWSPAGQKLW